MLSFVDYFPGSVLLQGEDQQRLHEWVGIRKDWKLVYKATKDGFFAKDFHKACDWKGENLGIIRSENGYLFGWWTPYSWQSSGNYVSDSKTFIFTLTNPAGLPAKYTIYLSQNTIFAHSSYGPVLGCGNDILVPDSFDVNDGWTNFPGSYEDTTGRGQLTFTGNSKFKVIEIEVFVPLSNLYERFASEDEVSLTARESDMLNKLNL